MFVRFFILLLFFFKANIGAASAIVSYQIHSHDWKTLLVNVKFDGNQSGVTNISIPFLNAINMSELVIKEVQTNKILKSEKLKDKKCSSYHPYYCETIKIRHGSNHTLEISYKTEVDTPGVLVSKDTVVFQGSKVLIYPELDMNEYKSSLEHGSLNLKYAKVLRNGYLKDLHNEFKNDDPYSDVYIISNNEIYFDKFVDSPDTGFITVGFNIADKETIAMANSTISNNKRFIEDILGSLKRTTKESVILVKIPENNTSWKGLKTEGVMLVLVDSKSKKNEIAHTISHEIMHELFSKGYGISVTFGPVIKYNHFWFDEGFADYYADLLNYRNGIITKKEYTMALNNMLKSHYEIYRSNQTMTSAYNSLAKGILESEGFFPNFYYSGRLIALDLDNIIRARSNNNLNLDNFLQSLIKSVCLQLPCNISQGQFIDELEKALSYRSNSVPKKYVGKYIIGFHPINPPTNIVEPNISLYRKEIREGYNIGFDDIKLLHTGVIIDVDKSSQAYKAGLRNNMKVLNYYINREKGKIEVEVENADSTIRVISFEPKGKMMLPYYK